MRPSLFAFLMPLLSAALCTCGWTQVVPQPLVGTAGAGQAFVDLLAAGDYAAAAGGFDETMSALMPAEKLRETWEGLVAQAGPLQRVVSVKTDRNGDYDIALVKCEFEAARVDLRVVFDAAGKVAGLFIAPGDRSDEYQPADYTKPDSFTECEVQVVTSEWSLPGTLSMPTGDGAFPGVVLVHGSGPQDQDESMGPNKPFRDLADGLASRGIAVLRYTKRSKKYGAEIAKHQDGLTVKDETIDDALSAARLLRGTAGVDPARVFVLGHSLGAMLAPRIGAADLTLAGLILMAGPTRPLQDVALEQLDYIISLKPDMPEAERQAIDGMKADLARVTDPDLATKAKPEELFFYVPASYWLDLRDYHPAEVAKPLPMPLFILQGGRDYQVTRQDFEGWQQALGERKDVQLKLYDNLNHLFAEGEGKATPDEYEQPLHVAPIVIEDLAAWITAQPAR
jgi:dienelactone hydrolase